MNNYSEYIELLKSLIAIPSFSGEEKESALLVEQFLEQKGLKTERWHHNIIARSSGFDPDRPTLLLNSHHDTVKPGHNWHTDPFTAVRHQGKIIGLGSNDAGASLVSLLALFCEYCRASLPFNLLFVASAEEEYSGSKGMRGLVEHLPGIDFAIVGEPTQMKMAIAEKGLMVIQFCARGKTGHAAREEGDNAIYRAISDIQWIQECEFPRISDMLGKMHMAVTVMQGGTAHNVIPDSCCFTVDIRTTDCYSQEEIVEILKNNLCSEITKTPGSLRVSALPQQHPALQVAKNLCVGTFGSATLSDQALMPWPSIKMGPGDSLRSHTPNEYILISEIEEGIALYGEFLRQLVKTGIIIK